jgi:hypothetical protein
MPEMPDIPPQLVEMVLANIPAPYPDIFKRPLHVRRMAQGELIYALLQQVWRQAWLEGLREGFSKAAEARFMIVTAEEREQMLKDFPIKEE